jgi:crotonobetainyl-CoA:carnitine CoA-transferase CaiB-like acyl-CoA transferase
MRPLQDIKVLDLTQVLVGPFAAMLLADLGAEVIKIEPPGLGDHVRGWTPPGCKGESPHFLAVNRSKKSVSLNLKSPAGSKIFLRLAEDADVLLENFRPGVMDRLGLGYDILRVRNQRIIYCSMSGFGQTGPAKHDAAYDLIIQGMGGAMSVTGEEGGRPLKPGIPQADVMGGLGAVVAVLAALYSRDRTGKGEYIDLSMLDIQVAAMGHFIMTYILTGRIGGPLGTAHPILTPYETFRTKSFEINIAAVTEEHWQKLCDLLGLSHLKKDERFETFESRVKNRKLLTPMIDEILLEKPGEEWIEILKAKKIPCGPINNVEMLLKHPQVIHRNMVVEVDHPTLGRIKIPGSPIRLGQVTEEESVTAPPLLGQHNREILCQRLGYSETDLENFRAQGVI